MEDLKHLESILSTVDERIQFVAKEPVKIGNRIVLKEPALRHHKLWLQEIRETAHRIQFLENRPAKPELIK